MRITPDPIVPGQESVWSYPRPAIAEACGRRIQITHRGISVADTARSIRTLETSHPPSYYFPREDVAMALLARSENTSYCEWKGAAVYFDVVIDGECLRDAAWSYPAPSPGFMPLQNHIAFYASPFERCAVDGETVIPQPGDFYGGWITSHVAGPFKGIPGSRFW